ncbi:hypothetical protein Pst134EB_026228 [Puccinia striiformis f. sp. tritici]|nr:hypothetical protein Pst134EB_026228 [Puccinia striiformis f. sp. tritici]
MAVPIPANKLPTHVVQNSEGPARVMKKCSTSSKHSTHARKLIVSPRNNSTAERSWKGVGHHGNEDEDAKGEDEDAEGKDEDAEGKDEDAEGEDEDAEGKDEDAEGKDEDAEGEDEDAEGGDEDEDEGAEGEDEDAEGKDGDAGGEDEDECVSLLLHQRQPDAPQTLCNFYSFYIYAIIIAYSFFICKLT